MQWKSTQQKCCTAHILSNLLERAKCFCVSSIDDVAETAQSKLHFIWFAREKKSHYFSLNFYKFSLCAAKKCCRKTHTQRETESIKSEARSCVPKWSYNNVDEIMLITSGYEKKEKRPRRRWRRQLQQKYQQPKIEARSTEKFIVKILKWGQ